MRSMRIYCEDGEIKVESEHLILPIYNHMIDKVTNFYLSYKDCNQKTTLSLKKEYMELLKDIPYTPFQVTKMHKILDLRGDLSDSNNIILYYNGVKLLTNINSHTRSIKDHILFSAYGAKYFIKINKNDSQLKLYLKMAWE